MSTSNGKSYPKGTASTCHDVSMTQVSETPKGVSPIFTELVALVQLEPNLSVGVSSLSPGITQTHKSSHPITYP